MSEKVKVFLLTDPNCKFSLLKFGSSKIDISQITKAEIKECPIFKPDLSNQAQDIPDLQKPGDQRSRKRKQREEEKIANAKSIILSLESSDSKKENEDGALDNISYFFMRRLPTGVAITPITDWYSAVPCITYPTLNESEAELEFGRRDHVDSVYPKIIKKKSGTAEENESDIQLQNKVALGQVNKLTQKFLKDKGAKFNPENDNESDESQSKKNPDLTRGEAFNEKNDQFIDNTLSGSESEDDELNEQGKELKKMLEKLDSGNESSDEAPESNLDSGSEEDIDQLEKKYSKSKIFQPDKKIQGSLTDKPDEKGTGSIGTSKFGIGESCPNLPSKVKNDTIEKVIEERIRKYLGRQPMNTVLLVKKLLSHSPPGYIKEQIIYHMANVLKRIGIKKRVIAGKTFLDLNKK